MEQESYAPTPGASGSDAALEDEVLVFPTSFAQQRLWLIQSFDRTDPSYNLPLHRWIRGPIAIPALERSLNEIVCRHEALRTTFSFIDGQPVQIVAPPRPVPLPVIDLTPLSPARRKARLQHLAQEEARRPFDLERDFLIRATLLRFEEDKHALLLTVHHITMDGWSVSIFFRELKTLYAAFAAGAPSPLTELPIQYGDFAVWQREWLQGEVLERQLAYWRGQLAGILALQLSTDRPRPTVQTHNGARYTFHLPPALAHRLRSFSREERATLFMTTLSAFKVLLHRYTGQTDLAVGTPVAGRSQREVEALIGMFVNTLVMRTDLSGNPTFRELLRRVRRVALEAYDHQHVPFEKLVQELRPERDQSRSPLFQVMFTVESGLPLKQSSSGLQLRPLRLGSATAKFDLTVSILERKRALTGRISFNADLFEQATVERMASHFRALLEALVTHPDRPIGSLPMVGDIEREQLLIGWNRTGAADQLGSCVHELFDAQAARTPRAEAVVCGEERLSYWELCQRANRLAAQLQALDTGPGAFVGMWMGRSIEMVIAMLATLKVGAAYVPLDPSYPLERLEFMLRDAQVSLLLTSSKAQYPLPAFNGVQVVDIDSVLRGTDFRRVRQAAGYVSPEAPSYVLYTSGSTGEPKGVVVSHRAIVNLVTCTDYVQLTPEDTIAHLSNTSFDAATFEVWGALLNGARLVILHQDLVLSPKQLSASFRHHGISTVFLTTPLFNLLAREAPRALAPLRHVLFGGEAVDTRWVRTVLRDGPPERLLHVYGPTETTTFATWHKIDSVLEEAATVPIGRPIARVRAYVLDPHLNPAPVGVPGELYIGGSGVARGYLNRPALTAERFIPDPFGGEPGARLYRTGDLARWLANGRIEFVGRMDRQVKIRGFRIEPGEIEAVLNQHSAVGACAVNIWEPEPGQKHLVAYVVTTPHEQVFRDDLRAHLRARLPDYMVPAYIEQVETLPLTPNGKLDRGALPPPKQAAHSPAGSGGPRTAIESRLVHIWEEVLKLSPIGVKDSFFDLGGHSLLAVELISRIDKAFGLSLPLSTLFMAPTVEALGRLLSEQSPSISWSALTPIQPKGTLPPLFCIHGVHGHIYKYSNLARQLGPEQPVYGLQAQGVDGNAIAHRSVEEIAREYASAIRMVSPEGPYILASNCAGGLIALEIAQQMSSGGGDVALLAFFDPPGPAVGKVLRRRLRLRELSSKRFYGYLIAKVCLAVNGAIPRRVRQAYTSITYQRLVFKYVPSTYEGRITIFRTRQRSGRSSLDRGWRRIARGGVDVYEIEGPHNLLQEPYVVQVSEHLKKCIDRALMAS